MSASTMKSIVKLQKTTMAFAVISSLSFGAIENSWAQDAEPDIYFGDDPNTTDSTDRDQKQRCVDDETVVYFSNGIANEWSHAFDARTVLEKNIDAHLDSNGLKTKFGEFKTANAFTQTSSKSIGFVTDTILRVNPDTRRLDYAQHFRRAADLANDPAETRRLIREAIMGELNLLDTSVAAEPHAKGYDAMLEKGRGNVVVGHSYGTIVANASYFGVPEYNRPGHAIVQTALMDDEISGADRFGGNPPYTTIKEDAIASVFKFISSNENGNVDNYPGEHEAPGGAGHNFVAHYMRRQGLSGPHPANEKIMSDIVRMQAELEPRPCHGFILGGAAIDQSIESGELSATQVSNNNIGSHVRHPSKAPPTVPPAPDGPTKLVMITQMFQPSPKGGMA